MHSFPSVSLCGGSFCGISGVFLSTTNHISDGQSEALLGKNNPPNQTCFLKIFGMCL